MTLKEDLYAYLSGNAAILAEVSTRIYPQVAEDGSSKPYIVYHIIGQDRNPHMGGPSGLVSSRVQLNIYGDSSVQVDAAVEAIRAELDGYQRLNMNGNQIAATFLEDMADLYIDPTDGTQQGTHGARLDFTLWHTESVPTHP